MCVRVCVWVRGGKLLVLLNCCCVVQCDFIIYYFSTFQNLTYLTFPGGKKQCQYFFV